MLLCCSSIIRLMFCYLLQSLNDLFLGLETDTSNIELPRIAILMQKVG